MVKKPTKVEITEMFMAQASNDECFYGIIIRDRDASGNPHVFSRIIVNDGLIQACAKDQWELGKMLDEMCIMILRNGLHNDAGVFTMINNEKFFLN
jgi:hypothetical protein